MSPTAQAPKAGLPHCKGRAPQQVLALIDRHLGLAGDPESAGARLVGVGVESDSVLWFVFQDDSGAEAWLAMSPAGGEPWAFNGRTLKLSPQPQEGGFTALHQFALARLGARLDGTPFERFLKLVESRAVPAQPLHAPHASAPGEKEPPLPGPHCEDWAHPDQWREFCCFSAIEWCPGETFLGAYMLSGATCSIRYGDLECQKGHLYIDGVAQTPWAFTKDAGGASPTGGPPEYLALIDDQDVIHGTGVRKVEGILELLQDDPSRLSLQFYNCCIPMMTGDDVRGPLARFQERTGRKVVFSDMSSVNCHQESLSRHILKELSAAPPTPSRAQDGRFNLAGFRRTRGRDELVSLLADIGAELNAAILPEVSPESLADYRKAAVQVLMPNAYYREVYEVLVEAQGLRTMQGCAPYGRDGALRWLREVGTCLGGAVAARLESSLAGLDKTFQPEWDRLRQRAAAHRAGFVVGPGDAARLADPGLSGGVQVPALLAEMGFGLDFLAFRESGRPDDPTLASLLAGLPEADRHRVVPFSGPDELLQSFRKGGLAIVYSNVRNDRRLTRNGLAGFSLRDLEMGLAGALRSLRRLVERCELPFFRENSRRLRGDP
ncbi:MAG: hypothetical protein NTY77_09070 [Elusimicrobia bacterium]|nr:hypothetical protein [Elusimicrobiota bacterium]